MSSAAPPPPKPPRLERLHWSAQWAFLLCVSALFVVCLEIAHMPAALLVGPMMAAIVSGTNGSTIRVHKWIFVAAQAIVGCLVATSISPGIYGAFLADWPLVIGAVVATLAASSLLGWLISRWRVLPGTTAVWGTAPGGATAMVLMAGAFGADERLVAFMQYLRVIMVSAAAAFIARLWIDTTGVEPPPIVWFPPIEWFAFAAMIAVAVSGTAIGALLRVPSPAFIGAVIVGGVAHLRFDVPLQLPEWLLAASYASIGWAIGLNFTSGILRHAMRALPQILGAILALMAFCGGLAWILSHELGIDPLTAYLATSPGGMDSIAIIAAAADNVDISFVMALQGARLIFVLVFGPSLARLVARLVRT